MKTGIIIIILVIIFLWVFDPDYSWGEFATHMLLLSALIFVQLKAKRDDETN